MDGEDEEELKRLYLDFLVECKPEGFQEQLLVKEIVDTIWRKNRFKVAEGVMLHQYRFASFGRGTQMGDLGTAFIQDAGSYGAIPKCIAVEDLLDRRLWRLFDRLQKLQERRGIIRAVNEEDGPTRPALASGAAGPAKAEGSDPGT